MSECPYFCEGSEAMVALEAMIDHAGLSDVLYAIEHICRAKAEHIRCNWQDNLSAKRWDSNARHANKCGEQVFG